MAGPRAPGSPLPTKLLSAALSGSPLSVQALLPPKGNRLRSLQPGSHTLLGPYQTPTRCRVAACPGTRSGSWLVASSQGRWSQDRQVGWGGGLPTTSLCQEQGPGIWDLRGGSTNAPWLRRSQ